MAASVTELADRDDCVRWITPGEARVLVRELRVPPQVERIAYYPEEGHVFPALLVSRLWGEARDPAA